MKRRQERLPGSPIFAVLVTVLVIGGVAAAAYIADQSKEKPFEDAKNATSTERVFAKDIPGLLLANESAVTLVYPGGRMERLAYVTFQSRFSDVGTWPTMGVDAATAQPRFFEKREEGVALLPGYLSPDRKFRARLLEAKADGAGVIELRRGTEAGRSVVLRGKDGVALKEVQLFGWFNSDAMAITAAAASGREIFSVNIDGQATRIAAMPETVLQTTLVGGVLFVTTAVQDGGIELAPKGPSDVFAYRVSGAEGSIFHSDAVVSSFVPDVSGSLQDRFAYLDETGQAWLMNKGQRKSLGKIRPLQFVGSHLVYRDGYDLFVRHVNTGEVIRVGALPEGAVSVYSFP